MLEQKRKIVENLKMRSEEWDEIDSVYHDYNANDCFIMIYSEVNNIYMSLFEHGKYENQATQNTSNEATEEIRKNIDLHNDDESIRKEIYERYQCRLTNLIYDIDRTKYNNAQTVTSLEEKWKGCFGLFLKNMVGTWNSIFVKFICLSCLLINTYLILTIMQIYLKAK